MAYEARSITLTADLFALAVHPTKPLFAAGLSSGHVYTYTWPSTPEDEDDDETEDAPTPSLKAQQDAYTIAWKTRRHKGSCRAATYSGDGEVLYTTGTDGLLKAASSETGRVISKALLPDSEDPAAAILALSPQHLLVGTDAGNVHLYDLRTSSALGTGVSASWKVHEDYISSLFALPSTSASTTGFSRQFIATGDTTLTHLDVRKPNKILARSEPQEDEILCTAYVTNAPSRNTGGAQKLLTGTSAGVVTTWNKGFWEDHQERIPLSRSTGDAIEALLTLPDDFEISGVATGWGAYFAAGSGDGKIRIVKMGGNQTLATLAHSYSADEARRMANGRIKVGDYVEGLEEGVSSLALDCEGRIVSGGGTVVKIWSPAEPEEEEAAEEEAAAAEKKRRKESGESGDEGRSDSDEVDSDSDDDKERKKRKKKKRKGGKGKAKSAGVGNVNSFKGLD